MKTKIYIKALDNLAERINKANQRSVDGIDLAVMKFAFLLETSAKRKVSGTGTGRTYKRRSVIHQASSPGDQPAKDTGKGVSSLASVRTGFASAEMGSLENIAPYFGYLEDGTKNMKARPWLEPTLTENSPMLPTFVETEMKKGGII